MRQKRAASNLGACVGRTQAAFAARNPEKPRRDTMRVWTALCCAVLLSTSGCGATDEIDAAQGQPLVIHAMKPDYFCAPEEASEASDMASAARQMQELNLSFNVQPFYRLVTAMVADPLAEEWAIEHHYSASIVDGTISLTARPVQKSGSYAIFQINSHVEGFRATKSCTAESCPREYFENDAVDYGSTTPATSSIDLGAASLRWNDHVIDAFDVRDGCDPVTQVSFERVGFADLKCWDRQGVQVSCTGVDIWPE
jgi:hypothetical protein